MAKTRFETKKGFSDGRSLVALVFLVLIAPGRPAQRAEIPKPRATPWVRKAVLLLKRPEGLR